MSRFRWVAKDGRMADAICNHHEAEQVGWGKGGFTGCSATARSVCRDGPVLFQHPEFDNDPARFTSAKLTLRKRPRYFLPVTAAEVYQFVTNGGASLFAR